MSSVTPSFRYESIRQQQRATLAEPRVVGQVRLYAVIRRSSQYRYQQRSKNPFEVHFGDYPGGYCVFGNDNQYRIEDLRFYVKLGEHWRAPS